MERDKELVRIQDSVSSLLYAAEFFVLLSDIAVQCPFHLKRTDEMFAHLEKAAAAAHDLPDSYTHFSLYIGEIVSKRTDFDTADSRSLCEIMCEKWLMEAEFDAYRDDKRFHAIIAELGNAR